MIDDKDNFVIIIGCGRIGATLTKNLISSSRNIVVIDKDKYAFNRLPNDFSGFMIEGNAADVQILEEAKISKADVVIAATNDDCTNILVSQIARKIFKVKKVYALIFEPAREGLFDEMDVETVCPSILTVNELVEKLPTKEAKS